MQSKERFIVKVNEPLFEHCTFFDDKIIKCTKSTVMVVHSPEELEYVLDFIGDSNYVVSPYDLAKFKTEQKAGE
jgi:hypothetical protein